MNPKPVVVMVAIAPVIYVTPAPIANEVPFKYVSVPVTLALSVAVPLDEDEGIVAVTVHPVSHPLPL